MTSTASAPVTATSAESRRGIWRTIAQRRPDFHWDPPGWLGVASVVAVAIVHAFVAWGARGPAIIPDETGIVGNAHVLSGADPTWTLAGSGYMPGLSLLITPAWWFTEDSFLVHHIALGVVVAISVALIWPLALIAREFGATGRGSVVIASVVALAPARTVASNYALPEGLLILVTAFSVVAVLRYSQRPSWAGAALVGAAAGAAVLAHGRGVAIALAAGVWLLWEALRHWRYALVGLITLAGVVTASFALFTWIMDQLYWSDDRVGSTLEGFGGDVGVMFARLIGMSWYAVAAWPAIVVIALVVIVRRIRTSPGALYLALATASAISLAVIALANPSPTSARIDGWFYGRYIEHMLVILAVIGLALLVRVRSGLLSVTAVGVTALVAAAFLVFTWPRIPVGGSWGDIHIAGISHFLSLHNDVMDKPEPWVALAAASVGVAAAFVALGWFRAIAVGVFGIYFALLSIANDDLRIDPRDDLARVSASVVASAAGVEPGAPIGFDKRVGAAINTAAFALNPHEVSIVDLEVEEPAQDYVYATLGSPEPLAAGALPYEVVLRGGIALWVYPGESFDRLDAEGSLLHPQE